MKLAPALLLALLPLGGVALADVKEDRRVAAEVDAAPEVRSRPDVEVRALKGSLDDRDPDDFADLAQKGVLDIERFTGMKRNRAQRIVIYVSPRIDISHTYPRYPDSPSHEARMFLDSERVASRTAPYLHELVHAVVGDGGAMWLEEGFAEWVASSVAQQYGGYYAAVLSASNDHVDAQARAVIATGGGRNVEEWFRAHEPAFTTPRERRDFYVLAHSFTKYLAQTVGTRELVQIHRSGNSRAVSRMSSRWEGRWMGELRR